MTSRMSVTIEEVRRARRIGEYANRSPCILVSRLTEPSDFHLGCHSARRKSSRRSGRADRQAVDALLGLKGYRVRRSRSNDDNDEVGP